MDIIKVKEVNPVEESHCLDIFVYLSECKSIHLVAGSFDVLTSNSICNINNTITDGGVAPQCTFARPT